MAPFPASQIHDDIQFRVEEPSEWNYRNRGFLIRGWCYSASRGTPKGVRIRVGALTIYGSTQHPRPDVAESFSDRKAHPSEFQVRCVGTQFKTEKITVEVSVTTDQWEALFHKNINRIRSSLPYFISAKKPDLLAYQFAGHGTYPPRPIPEFSAPVSRKTLSSDCPKISIVTPSFNQGNYLPTAIKSVLNQGLPPSVLEYGIMDGSSTDGSMEFQNENYPGLSFAISEPDEGQADAISKGFAQTSGGPNDVMAWINADDAYVPGALAGVLEIFKNEPSLDVIYGNRILVDENTQEIGRWFIPGHHDQVMTLADYIPQETLFWRRRIWDQVGGIDPKLQFAMDWDLLLRFREAGANIRHFPQFLGCFRVHPQQKTSSQMHSVGEKEISSLRMRTHGRRVTELELSENPVILRFLRKSAREEFWWRWRNGQKVW